MVFQVLQKVYRKPTYAILALSVSVVVFTFAVWLPNIRLIANIIISADVPFVSKIKLPLSLLGSIATNFTLLPASYTIAIAFLAGINAALVIHLMRTQREFVGGGIIGASGIFTGALGLGCAACGSLILTSIIGTVGGIGVLALLPLRGSEFGIIGVLLLGYSTYLLAKRVTKPLVCESADIKSLNV